MRVKKLRAAACCLMAVCTGGLFADDAEDVSGGDPAPVEPVFGRVFGMYCLNKEAGQTPIFPFRAQWEVNPYSTKTSGSNASPDTSNLSAEDLASLPTNAFTRTGYVHTDGKGDKEFDVFNVLNLTPGATYRMDVYLNEPYFERFDPPNGRAQYVRVNNENVKDASGADVKLTPVEDCGGKAIVGKFSYDVVAMADGTLSFAFPRASNQSALNVVTLAGTNRPAAVTAPTFKSNGKTDEVELHWPLARDAFAYYVQQQMDGGAWETVAETTTTNVVLTLPAVQQTLDYRVISSNGLGVAEGTVVSHGIRRRTRYAVGLGLTAPAGRFVPANAVLTSCVRPDLTKVAAPPGIEGQYAADGGIYTNYVWGVDNKMSFAFSNLTANAAYAFRIHFIEGSGTSNTNQTRLIDISTNGALAQTSYDALAACGYRQYGVGYLDMTSAADADGTLTFALTNTASSTFKGISVCAVEVLARADEPFASEIPALVVTAFAEGVRIVPETRHAQNVYEIWYVDAATASAETTEEAGTRLVANVPAAGFFDFDVPETGTRWYRVRAVAEDGTFGAWSPWTGAARGDRAFSAALRVNFTENDIMPPNGWVNDKPFRAGHIGAFTQSPTSTTAFVVLQNVIPDQAPDLVYLTGILGFSEDADKKTYRFVFPGFDSARTYRLRLHLVENYYDKIEQIGKRTFRLAVNRLARSEWRGIDSLALANGEKYRPSVFEATVTPALDGTIRMDILREKENPTLRGVEFIPVECEGETFGPGRVAFLRDAGADAVAGSNETCVAEAEAPRVWSWTTEDVPENAGDRPRILAHGRFYAPWTDLYTAEVTKDVDGTFDLWVDGQVFSVNKAVELAVGPHDVYVSYRPANRASCTATLTWQTESGVPPRALRTDAPLAYPDGWHFAQIGPHAAPAFLRGTTPGAWKMAASGNDTWGAADCATFLYHAAGRGTFDCSFRVTGLGGTYTDNTRLGVMVRSSLESAKTDAFMLYAGLTGNRKDLRGYLDADPDNGTFNIEKGFDVPAGACSNFPFTVRAVRTREGLGDRFVLSFTAADGTLVHAETQDVARAANVYVGPVAVAHHTIGTALTHYEFADLEFEDTTPRALVIIVR